MSMLRFIWLEEQVIQPKNMRFFFLLLLRWIYEPSQNSSSVGGNTDKRYLEALSILERPAISFISWERHLPFTNTRTSACSLSLRKIHRSVLCCKGETGKGVNRCERSKDQVTSLPQKQFFVKRTGLILLCKTEETYPCCSLSDTFPVICPHSQHFSHAAN